SFDGLGASSMIARTSARTAGSFSASRTSSTIAALALTVSHSRCEVGPSAAALSAPHGGRTGDHRGAVRGALARLAAKVGAADLQSGGGPESDRSRDA